MNLLKPGKNPPPPKKKQPKNKTKKAVGELPSNGEVVKNENDLKYRLERISSCCQDAAVDEHRPVNKK